jgi:hypothetical protein
VGGRATPAARSARLAARRGEGVEIGEDRGPRGALAEGGDAALQLDLQHQGEERAEDMAADGLVELVEDRPGGEEVLVGAEDALHRPELLVAQHGGGISRRGNTYLRRLFVQGARALLRRPQSWARYGFSRWLTAAARRLHRNVLAVALANKLARITWSVLRSGRRYDADINARAA